MSATKDHLTIPVKPALVTAANVATLTGVLAVSSGLMAAAAVAATLVGGTAAVKSVRKTRSTQTPRVRSQSAARATRSGLPSRSKSLGARSGSAGSRSMPRLTSAAKKVSGTLTAGTRRAAPGLTSTRSRKSPQARRVAGPMSMAARSLARKVPRAQAARAAKWTRSQGSKARSQATKARTLLPTRETTKRVSRTGWKKARGWIQKNVMGRDVKKNKRPISPARKDIKSTVSFKRANATLEGAVLNPSRIIPSATPYAISHNVAHASSTPGGIMKHYAEKMLAEACEFDAPGVLGIIDYIDDNVHGSLTNVAEAFDALSVTARNKWPFDDAIAQKLHMISECLWSASSMARGVVPDIEEIHKSELDKLRRPDRPGMEKFDLAANGMA